MCLLILLFPSGPTAEIVIIKPPISCIRLQFPILILVDTLKSSCLEMFSFFRRSGPATTICEPVSGKLLQVTDCWSKMEYVDETKSSQRQGQE